MKTDSSVTAEPTASRPDQQAPTQATGQPAGQGVVTATPATVSPGATTTPSQAAKPSVQPSGPTPVAKTTTSSNTQIAVHLDSASKAPGSSRTESSMCLGVTGIHCNYHAEAPLHLISIGEFLPVFGLFLALLAVIRPKMDFRLGLAGLSPGRILWATAIAAGSVLIGALLPMWSGSRWPICGVFPPLGAVRNCCGSCRWPAHSVCGTAPG